MSQEPNFVEILVVLETPDGTWEGKGLWHEPENVEGWKKLCKHAMWAIAGGVCSRAPLMAYVNLTIFATGLVFQEDEKGHPVHRDQEELLLVHEDTLGWRFAPKPEVKGG